MKKNCCIFEPATQICRLWKGMVITMSLTNEDLLAISLLLDSKFDAKMQPIENRLKRIEVNLLENNVIPRLNTIESCYTDTYNRYKDYGDRMQSAFEDIALLKKVVSEHSVKLQNIY